MQTKETQTGKKRPVKKQTARKPVRRKPVSQQTAEAQTGGKRPVKKQTVRRHVRRRPAPQQQTQRPREVEIVYTPPKPFNRNRFLLRLATVLAVVLALILGMSIFFKVEKVYVSGIHKYTAWDVKEAAGIQEGENLLTLSRAKVSGKIITNLPYVDDVRVSIKLPDTVNIELKELDVVYAMEADDNSWWLMSSTGRLVERTNVMGAKAYTQIKGVKIQHSEVGAQAAAADELPEETQSTETVAPEEETQIPLVTSPVPVVTGADRLENAFAILHSLEDNSIMGEVSVIDVESPMDIQLWYGERYQVILGDNSRLDYKIKAMKAAVEQMGPYQSGVLDVSFTIWPTEVGYTPFS